MRRHLDLHQGTGIWAGIYTILYLHVTVKSLGKMNEHDEHVNKH